ncbi:ArsR family transcriptional regulator [Pseudomonas graminis]|uniref:ArsR/SmtB family transcription factor n=1 Tax=Pseudomonas graminis TaxID=158627 RepID=UPI0010D47B90|nr:ArsR family transcriptional regulator [Pseudomonas graminis]
MSSHSEEDLPLVPPDFQVSIRAIAHPVRREILQWLKEPLRYFPDQEYGQHLGVCIGQIVLRCDLPQSTVSSHLALLKAAGLVEQRKSGTVHFLRRNEACIRSLAILVASQLQSE